MAGPKEHQLANANTTIAELEARQKVYELAHGRVDPDDLLVQITRTVLEARRLAAAAPPSPKFGKHGYTRPESTPPGGGKHQRQLARLAEGLELRLANAVKGYWHGLERLDDPDRPRHRPDRTPKVPTVRCRRRDCPAYNQRVPSQTYTGDPDRPIEPNWYCPECDQPYPNHPAGQPAHQEAT